MNERFRKVACVAGTVLVGVPCAVVVELVGVVMKCAAWLILGVLVGLPLWLLIGALATSGTGWHREPTVADGASVEQFMSHGPGR